MNIDDKKIKNETDQIIDDLEFEDIEHIEEIDDLDEGNKFIRDFRLQKIEIKPYDILSYNFSGETGDIRQKYTKAGSADNPLDSRILEDEDQELTLLKIKYKMFLEDNNINYKEFEEEHVDEESLTTTTLSKNEVKKILNMYAYKLSRKNSVDGTYGKGFCLAERENTLILWYTDGGDNIQPTSNYQYEPIFEILNTHGIKHMHNNNRIIIPKTNTIVL